jgi:hypothetical protein
MWDLLMDNFESVQQLSLEGRELSFPKIIWKFTHTLSIGSYILGIVSLVITELSLTVRLVLLFSFFFLPILTPIFIWFGKTIWITYKRINIYPKLIHELEASRIGSLQYRKNSTNILLNLLSHNFFEINKAQLVRKDVCIKINAKKNYSIFENDFFAVFDKEDNIVVGTFQVTSIFDNHFYAISSDCDPIWKGYIHENPNSMYPNLLALHIPKRSKE